jgi:hypothetical protein
LETLDNGSNPVSPGQFEEEKFIELKDIPTLIEPMDRENLIVLISKLVEENPDMQFWVQKYVKGKLKK